MSSSNICSFIRRNYIKLAADKRSNRAASSRCWRNLDACKVLMVTEDNPISKSQIFPFHYYAEKFQKRWHTEFREINIDLFEQYPDRYLGGADIVFMQPWFNKGQERIVSLITRLRACNPSAQIIFFDSYAPLDLRFAAAVSPFVDYYVKKHVHRDRAAYGQATEGDDHLVEYYNRIYNLPAATLVKFDIPPGFIDKLIVGPSFFTSRNMLTAIASSLKPLSSRKTLNVHARLGAKGVGWYQQMREHALKACDGFSKGSVITSEAVPSYRYFWELKAARICFSPFGYGEVCWRDYEAIMCGALLIKPDMSHVETSPDIFIPEQTYIPVAWDFSDLHEKISYYLENEEIRQRVTQQAFFKLREYINSEAFLDQFSVLFENKGR